MKIKKQLKKIKKLLRIIASNTEQKDVDADKVAERLEEIIHHQYESQSCAEALKMVPCVVQLPVKDLVELYAARAELLNRSYKNHKK